MKRIQNPVLKFHGVRGSRPTHMIQNLTYGGNSTCLEIDSGLNFTVIIDAGSGLQHISKALEQSKTHRNLHILITHTHWDHILHVPFLKQLYDTDQVIHFYAPKVADKSFEELFKRLFVKGRLPIPEKDISSKVQFHQVHSGEQFVIENKIRVSTTQVNHQHLTLAYKLTIGSASVAVIPDCASIENGNYLGDGMQERAKKIGPTAFEHEYTNHLVQFLKDVHTLVFDTHFNTKNIKPDWGHATPEIAVDLALKAGIRRLFMFHHAPEEDDTAVTQKQIHAQNLMIDEFLEVFNAREGDEWLLPSA